MRRTVTFMVTVELDDMPGAMHTEESAQTIVTHVLNQQMSHYNPTVMQIPKPHCGHPFYMLTKSGSAACGEFTCNNYIH